MSILSVVMLSQAYTHLKTFQIVYFAYVEFIVFSDASIKLLTGLGIGRDIQVTWAVHLG